MWSRWTTWTRTWTSSSDRLGIAGVQSGYAVPPRFSPRTLAHWPWVVVRVDCTLCRRRGRYNLARLAAKYGPEQTIDGLLRDLAHNCPWYNERPRKYEPRCGARFTDLEHSHPAADHPDEPLHRQRQPAREDVPKPKGADRFPATDDGRGPSLAAWPDPEMALVCDLCGRRDVYTLAELRGRFGAAMLLTNLRVALSADCPRRRAHSIYEQCGALLKRKGAG